MTLSRAEKTRRAETAAAKVAAKNVRTASDEPGAKISQSVASPAIRASKDIPDTGVVTVACKMPSGLILRIFEESEEYENLLGGGQRKTKIMRPVGKQIRVYGYAVPANKRPKFTITGTDFALTENVDAKFFKTWWEQNQELPVIKAGLIWCMKTKADADDKAEDMTDARNGLEPMAQKNDPRAGKAANPNLEDIGPADRKAAARTV